MTESTGTEVRVTAKAVAQISARAERLLDVRAQARFRELVLDWAAADEGLFPTRDMARDEARAELEVLCRALGGWAALPPEEVFPSGLIRAERLLPRDEEWWE